MAAKHLMAFSNIIGFGNALHPLSLFTGLACLRTLIDPCPPLTLFQSFLQTLATELPSSSNSECWCGAERLLAPAPTTDSEAVMLATTVAAPAETFAEPAGVDLVNGFGLGPLYMLFLSCK